MRTIWTNLWDEPLCHECMLEAGENFTLRGQTDDPQPVCTDCGSSAFS